jgi:protein subunit release factor A
MTGQPLGPAVQKTDTITDPTARLAQEYAQELENMAAIRAALENGRNLVRTLEADEAASQKKCSAVFKQLQASMVPATPKVTRKKRVEIREKEAAAKEEIILADSAAH